MVSDLDNFTSAPYLLHTAVQAQRYISVVTVAVYITTENDFGNLGDISTLADPTVVDDLIAGRKNR
ncbi:MAG: hypothetical protein L3J04_05660 [Robiginitomaculum sp.]|nr:hypothetical protein [Robiginitomaculum sp.]